MRIDLPYDIDDDEPDETPEEYLLGVAAAEALVVLAEMARERGLDKIADLGDLPPLDPETKAKYLARAKNRAKEAGLDAA